MPTSAGQHHRQGRGLRRPWAALCCALALGWGWGEALAEPPAKTESQGGVDLTQYLMGGLSPLAVDVGVPIYVPQGQRCGTIPGHTDHEAYVQRLARTPVLQMDLFELTYLREAKAHLAARLQAGADPNVCGGPLNTSLLSAAAVLRDVGMVQLLLDHGAQLEWPRDEGGLTAFLIAVHGDAYDVAELLMARGANVKSRTNTDRTALYLLAESYGFKDRYRPESQEKLALALLNSGLSPNDRDSDPRSLRTPLLQAALMGRAPLVKLFLANGGDPELRDAKGRNAADLARLRKHEDVLKVLDEWRR